VRDSVADPSGRPSPKGQRPGRRPLSALAVRRTIGKPSCARPIVLIHARNCKVHCRLRGKRRLGVLRPERRASIRARALAPCSPHATCSKVLGDDALISYARLAWQVPRSRIPWSRALDGDPREAETCTRPAGSATFLRPTRGRHRAPARVSYYPQSSAETANATPKPSVVTRPTALPPRR